MTLNDDVEAPERQRSGDYGVTRFNALRHWRPCNWLEVSSERRLTMRPRFTAGR